MKKAVYIIIVIGFFFYGFSIPYLKIFPFRLLLQAKQYVEYRFDLDKTEGAVPQDVEVIDTFLERLLIKKIGLRSNVGGGGGISYIDDVLYVASYDGVIYPYSLTEFRYLENDIDRVPMNLDELIISGHPYRNSFTQRWFRVNGIFTQMNSGNEHVIYLSHNGYDQDRDCITFNVSKIKLTAQKEMIQQNGGWEILFTAEPCIEPEPEFWLASKPYSGHISGGRIIEYDSSHLLVSVGDYNHHGMAGAPEYAMNRDNPYGKFIQINKETGEWSVYAMGNRNPSGLYKDRSGTIWSVENGPAGGDELNVIEKGENYGWPKVSYGLWYDLKYNLPGDPVRGVHTGYKTPVFAWAQAVAPSNLIRVEDDRFSYWKGDLLVGTMRDQSLRRLRLNENNSVVYDERIPLDHRLRDMTVLRDGRIAIITDDSYLIILDSGGPLYDYPDEQILARMEGLNRFDGLTGYESENQEWEEPVASAMMIFQNNCSVCHGFTESSNVGPHLNNLIDREIGGVDGFAYSPVLDRDKRRWTDELFTDFMLRPHRQFQGNKMPQITLTAAEVDSLILYIRNNSQ